MSCIRNRPGWAFWVTVAQIFVPLLFVASFGPVCWISSRAERGARFVSQIYRPLMTVSSHSDTATEFAYAYPEVFAAEHWSWAWVQFADREEPHWEFYYGPDK